MSGHPEIASAGESLSLRRICSDVGIPNHDGQKMANAIRQMPADAAQKLGQRYLTDTGQDRARFVVDKSLHNFELLGIFAVMFPMAKILHMTRDPMDNCVSCYLQRLPPAHKYTTSLSAMGHSYVQYRRLMRHWQAVLPNDIMTLSYEDMVADLEAQARAVINYLGLDWHPNCLNYQDNANRVQTISITQVRKPIYTSSMRRWTRYEPFLDPLKAELAPLYPDGFDAPARLTEA